MADYMGGMKMSDGNPMGMSTDGHTTVPHTQNMSSSLAGPTKPGGSWSNGGSTWAEAVHGKGWDGAAPVHQSETVAQAAQAQPAISAGSNSPEGPTFQAGHYAPQATVPQPNSGRG